MLTGALAVGAIAVTLIRAADSDQTMPGPFPQQQRDDGGDRPRPRADGFRGAQRPFGRDGVAATRPSDEEWQQISQFMQEHSPKRWAKFNDMNLPAERSDRLRGFVALRYHNLMELKQNDPKMFEVRLRRMPIEDEVFALGWELRHKPENPDAINGKLKEQVRALIDNRIEEHELRVRTLKERLAVEEDRLAQAKANKDEVIVKSMQAIRDNKFPAMGDFASPAPGPGAGDGKGHSGQPQRGSGGGRRDLRNASPVPPATTSQDEK
jgi:hypothetical protein